MISIHFQNYDYDQNRSGTTECNPGVEKIELRVRERNTVALQLYARFDFVEEGRFERRIKLGDGTCIADISMAKFFIV